MRAMTLLSAFVLAAALAAIGAPAAVTLRGVISSAQEGVPIGRAFVLVHDSSGSDPDYVAQDWQMNTADGNFSFVLSPGCYDLFVSASWFHPHTERICLKDKRGAPLKIKMKPDHPIRFRQD